jgi:hypothetical protein
VRGEISIDRAEADILLAEMVETLCDPEEEAIDA